MIKTKNFISTVALVYFLSSGVYIFAMNAAAAAESDGDSKEAHEILLLQKRTEAATEQLDKAYWRIGRRVS